jgi:hypothetical protein
MSEMLFVEALRRYVDTLPLDQTGWLAGMRDPAVGRALALMHERPAEPVDARTLGVTRAALARFDAARTIRPLHRPAADAIPGASGGCSSRPDGCATPMRRSWKWRSRSATRTKPHSRALSNAPWALHLELGAGNIAGGRS